MTTTSNFAQVPQPKNKPLSLQLPPGPLFISEGWTIGNLAPISQLGCLTPELWLLISRTLDLSAERILGCRKDYFSRLDCEIFTNQTWKIAGIALSPPGRYYSIRLWLKQWWFHQHYQRVFYLAKAICFQLYSMNGWKSSRTYPTNCSPSNHIVVPSPPTWACLLPCKKLWCLLELGSFYSWLKCFIADDLQAIWNKFRACLIFNRSLHCWARELLRLENSEECLANHL